MTGHPLTLACSMQPVSDLPSGAVIFPG